ncbi:hypothetical protein ACYSNW_14980 [Enterococcus sp. LJL99]
MNLGIISASGKLGSILMSKIENNRTTQTTAIVRDKKNVEVTKHLIQLFENQTTK